MRLSTTLPTYCTGEQLVSPETLREWARRADEAGVDGLWAIDHLVQPPTYATSVLDPLVTFAHAAAVTDGMDFGTSIYLLPLRRTANVASQAATLAHLVDGDLTLGVGAGYVPKEFELSGVPMRERGPRLNEGIEVLDALFAGEASFDGRFHSFEDARVDPVPADPPGILAGGDSNGEGDERTIPGSILDRIVAAGGWIAPPSNPEKLAAEWDLIAEGVRERGVDPDSLDLVALNYTHLVEGDADRARAEQREAFAGLFSPSRGFAHAEEHCLVGTMDEVLAKLEACEAIGFDEVIAGPAASDPDALDRQMALLTDRVLPRFG